MSKVRKIIAIITLCCTFVGSAKLPFSHYNTIAYAKTKTTTSYSGFYGDDETGMIIKKTRKNKYKAEYYQFRLCRIEDLKGKAGKKYLTLKGLDPGDDPITFRVYKKKNGIKLVFYKTTWVYFTEGDIKTFTKNNSK